MNGRAPSPFTHYARRIPARTTGGDTMHDDNQVPNPSRSGSCLGAALAVALDPRPALGMIDRPLSPELLAAGECIAALRAARDALAAIVAAAPTEEPEAEDYDDMDSAYVNGLEGAAWEAAEHARPALAAATRALARVDGAA